MPSDHDAVAMIRRSAGETPESGQRVRLRVRRGAAASLRARAEGVSVPAPQEGWDDLELRAGSLRRLAREISAAGPQVQVLEPDELRELVRDQLADVLAAHGGGAV